MVNKADNSNNKERNARITFSLQEGESDGWMNGGGDRKKRAHDEKG